MTAGSEVQTSLCPAKTSLLVRWASAYSTCSSYSLSKFLSIRNMVPMSGGRSGALCANSLMQKAAKDAATPSV
uniref:Uncharacterized protein n=1 Tax=Arundo donax TaxID=35708 RepID=A0A0A8ZC46_ARUDO